MPAYGIDTSIFVRLLTGQPGTDYEKTVARLVALRQAQPQEITVSNIVIAEAYAVLQHHYGFSKEDSRSGLVSVLTSGLVTPVSGDAVLAALEAIAYTKEPGLTDRLIALDYATATTIVLTNDRKMARLSGCQLLG
jgi:predicted nucleic acid-binding protein